MTWNDFFMFLFIWLALIVVTYFATWDIWLTIIIMFPLTFLVLYLAATAPSMKDEDFRPFVSFVPFSERERAESIEIR